MLKPVTFWHNFGRQFGNLYTLENGEEVIISGDTYYPGSFIHKTDVEDLRLLPVKIKCEECTETKTATEFSDTLCADCFEQGFQQSNEIWNDGQAKCIDCGQRLGQTIYTDLCIDCGENRINHKLTGYMGFFNSNSGGDTKMIDRHHVCDSTCDPIKVHTDKLDSLTSFVARKRYMNSNFIAIGTGTGRKVYDIGQGRVLKLALNRKGVAQNSVETDKAMHDWHGTLLPKIYDTDKDDKWLICDLAVAAKSKDFARLLGVSMDTLFYYIEYKMDAHPSTQTMKLSGELGIGARYLSSKVQEIIDLIINFDLMYRDITRKGSWGIIGDRLVLRDFGLSQAVWDGYYKPIKKDGRFVYGEKNL